MARFEDRAHPNRERLSARAAFPQARPRRLTLQLRRFANRSAVRASWAIVPKPTFDVGDRSFFVTKVRDLKGGFHGGYLRSRKIYIRYGGMSGVTLPSDFP
jgi:hypothetical protein